MTLDVKDLSVGFQTRSGLVSAVRRVSLRITRGERVALVGESGCGKSVMALALLGLLPRNAQVEGSASLGGSNLLDPKVAASMRGREISMCWSNAERFFNPVVPIGAQIEEAYALHYRRRASAARERTLALLREVGFEDPERICGSFPFQLSGGMNQRAMIAMSLMNAPRLLLVDEPTRGLDDENRERVVRCLMAVSGASMLVITHDMDLVERIAQRVYFMRAGEILDDGPVPGVLRAPGHPYSEQLLRAGLDA
jgi:ABC-type dipeptide/oligopeptide/nickel transport system ATPase component